ncbi:glycosyltransferase [Novosphingobium sp.]|uniref:glycosyltransferase n=1 Tax=Novosphingobium sp. TaxID=1874826 RepID=UPI003B51C91F
MTVTVTRMAREVGRNLRKMSRSRAPVDDNGEIWRRFATLETTMAGCRGGSDAVQWYKTLATRDEALRPLISDAVERFLAVYRAGILLPMPQDGVILDIGAGCGLFAVLAALLHPAKTIRAFEPDEDLCALVRAALSELGLVTVELVCAAVVPAGTPDKANRLDIFEDTVFRSVGTTGAQQVKVMTVTDMPLNADAPIALLKITAPGMTLPLAHELAGRTHALLAEVWQVDYAAPDHPVLAALIDRMPMACVRDAESAVLYKTTAADRTGRVKSGWSTAIIPGRAGPLISVIVPTYNIGDLIEPCVESLIASIDRPTEILVINDGATQKETLASLKKVAGMAHTRVIDKPNGGCASARNFGMQVAAGKFVTLIDGDDLVEPAFLPLLSEAIHIQGTNIAEIGFADYMMDSGRIKDIPEPYAETAASRGILGYDSNLWSLLRRQPAIWRRLYRTDWLRQNGLTFPESLKAYDDMEFQFLSLYLNGGVAYANTRGYLYRKDRPGQDVAASDTRHFGTFQMLVTIENFLRNRRAHRDHFVMFDLFALDCLAWSYSLINPRLHVPFLDAARTFLLGGKSFERAANVHWEITRQIGSATSNFARDFCAEIPDRHALQLVHDRVAHYADHVYDYHFPLEVSG